MRVALRHRKSEFPLHFHAQLVGHRGSRRIHKPHGAQVVFCPAGIAHHLRQSARHCAGEGDFLPFDAPERVLGSEVFQDDDPRPQHRRAEIGHVVQSAHRRYQDADGVGGGHLVALDEGLGHVDAGAHRVLDQLRKTGRPRGGDDERKLLRLRFPAFQMIGGIAILDRATEHLADRWGPRVGPLTGRHDMPHPRRIGCQPPEHRQVIEPAKLGGGYDRGGCCRTQDVFHLALAPIHRHREAQDSGPLAGDAQKRKLDRGIQRDEHQLVPPYSQLRKAEREPGDPAVRLTPGEPRARVRKRFRIGMFPGRLAPVVRKGRGLPIPFARVFAEHFWRVSGGCRHFFLLSLPPILSP